jgi:hypothetical protein
MKLMVHRQNALAASEKLIWAGWRNIGKGAVSGYGRLLSEEKFREIADLTREL